MTKKDIEPNSIFKIFIEQFNEFSVNAYNILKEDPDYKQYAQLYHYTSLHSLQNIIMNQSFRATSIYMLNDPNELLHGYEQISNWFLNDVRNNNFEYHTPRFKSIYGFPAFVFSLTELNDDMHFWEKYGDKHKGIRIGFTPENLLQYWRKLNNVEVILAPVIYQDYDGNFIGIYSRDFIKFKNSFIQKINEYISENALDNIELGNLAYCSALIASLIKRKEWALEKEWRIVCIPGGYVHEAIIGDFSGGLASAKLENKSEDTWALLTNRGHDGLAHKDVLKVGHLAGNVEFIRYTIQLLFKQNTGNNYFDENISQSIIETR